MPKEFYVMSDESTVGAHNAEPYIFKVLVEVYINKLAPLADPENKLIFRVAMWCWDAELDRKKRIAGIRYYPLQKKLTKITNKVEIPYKVFNQTEVFKALDATIKGILNDEEFNDEVKDTIGMFCAKCARRLEWNQKSCSCELPKKKEIKPTWSK